MIRQEELTNKLQNTLSPLCETDIVLKTNIELRDLLTLKNATYIINNFITYKLTLAFIEQLYCWNFINNKQYVEMITNCEQTSTNANGFDVLYEEKIRIVAEVKSNIPCRGNRFGAAQRKSIFKDLDALKNGKTKSIKNTENYYKFMVLLYDSNNIIESLEALIKSKHMANFGSKVCIVNSAASISLNQINVILIKI